MAEVMGIMLRRNPRQVFTIFITWNLSALWRRIKKLQRPWAPFDTPLNREFPRDITTEVKRRTEEYLRPTADTNPYEPEIVALAVKLGMREKDKREYAETAYHWVKNNIVFYMETPPSGVVDTLKKSYGLCMNKMAVLAALVRLAGIPARFLTYRQEMGGGFMEIMADEMIGDAGMEIAQELQENRPTFTHGCIELFLDGKWVPADLTWTDEEEVGMELPISRFGESPFGKWYHVLPGSTSVSETLPMPRFRFIIWMSILLLRGLYDKLNERFKRLRETGRKRLEEMGREAYLKSKKKFYIPPPPLILEEQDN